MSLFESFVLEAVPWIIVFGFGVIGFLIGFGLYALFHAQEPDHNYQSPGIRDNVRRVK